VPVGLARAWFCCWARCARIFIKKKVYYGRYNTYVWILLFSVARGTWDWVDGSGWVWMTRAINSMRHQSWCLGFVLAVGPRFLQQKFVYSAI